MESTENLFLWSTHYQKLFRTNPQNTLDCFNPWEWSWTTYPSFDKTINHSTLEQLNPLEALRKISTQKRNLPIGVIGPREPSKKAYAIAESLGKNLASLNLQLICGGKSGVMEAVAKGNYLAGGNPIGLLPEEDWQEANPYIKTPIATGIGKARNAIIAQACVALIAIEGGYGTISEIAFGLQFKKLVLSLAEAPNIQGVIHCDSIEEALETLASYLLTTNFSLT